MEDKKIEDFKKELSDINNNITQLKQDKTKIIVDIKSDIKKWCGKHIGWTIGGISLLTLYALFQIYTNVVNKSEKFITDAITLKFAEPRIIQTLNYVAENQAKEIIESKLNPAIQKGTSTVNQKIDSFEADLQQFKEKYDTELTKLTKEVEYIKNRNEILKLSDLAIATGDAEPFEKLESIYDSSPDEDIKMSALAGIFQVKEHFATMTRIKGITVKYTEPNTGKEFIEDKIPTEALLQGLKNAKPWQYRARIVDLIKNRKEKTVPEALLSTIEDDTKLEIRKKAMDSFESITGYTSKDIFNYEPAAKWWQQNKSQVESELKDLQTIEMKLEENKN